MKYNDSSYVSALKDLQYKVQAIQDSNKKLMEMSVNLRAFLDKVPSKRIKFTATRAIHYGDRPQEFIVTGYGISGVGAQSRLYLDTDWGSVDIDRRVIKILDDSCKDASNTMKHIATSEENFKAKFKSGSADMFFQFTKAMLAYLIGADDE
jgi:hypothetical protein